VNLGGIWLIRAAWLVLPLVLVPALGPALDDRSTPVQLLVATAAWLGWTGGLVTVLVPRTIGLTAVRVLSPAALVLAMWAAVAGEGILWGAVAVVVTAAVAIGVMAPEVGDLFVNGSAYGDERRFALRPPAAVVFGPVQLIWVLILAGAATGPLLLAARQWVVGAVLTAVGTAVVVFGTRSLHQLARRWLVMVPAGVVIHDPASVTSQLFRRRTIASMGPAPADSGALDLTAGALGLALEMQLTESATLELRRRREKAKVVHASAVLFTPTIPGEVLREAARRRIAVR
jgi:hypothetical protein